MSDINKSIPIEVIGFGKRTGKTNSSKDEKSEDLFNAMFKNKAAIAKGKQKKFFKNQKFNDSDTKKIGLQNI